MTRDEVLKEFGVRSNPVERMVEEIVRLREQLASVEAERDCAKRILALLREPSDMVVDALREYVLDLSRFDDALKAIHLAVAAAEQEVQGD